MSRKDQIEAASQDELDEMVHELKAEEAASINNGGREAQLTYLLPCEFEFAKQIIFSTCHMAKETNNLLLHDKNPGFICQDLPYGWRIYTYLNDASADDGESRSFPADLQVLVDIAKKYDCLWLILDQDGPEHDELPRYEW